MIGNNEVVTDSLTSPFFLNLFQDTKEFLSNSENIKQLIREGIRKPFDEIEKEISETIGEGRTFKYALEQAKQTGNLEYWLQPLLTTSFGSDIKVIEEDFNKLMRNLAYTQHSSNNPGNKIDFREMVMLKGLEFWEVVWDFSTESYLLKPNYTTDRFTQINLAKSDKRFFFTKSNILKGYQLHWMNYLTTPINSKEFNVAEAKIVKITQTLLLEDIENNINSLKKEILSPVGQGVVMKPEHSPKGFDIYLPFLFWKYPKTIQLLEKQLWSDLEAIQDLQAKLFKNSTPNVLIENYQRLIQTDKFKHYLNLIQEGLIDSTFSKTIQVFHKTVTVTEESYSEVVTEVKEYLYSERYSEFKILQPFLLFLNPTDIFEEEELKTIFVEGMANLDYIKKSKIEGTCYFARLDLTQVGTPINLNFASETQLKGIGFYPNKMVDIFKGISSKLDVNFVMDFTKQDLYNTIEIQTEIYRTETSPGVVNLKKITELMRIIFGSNTLRGSLVGKSMLEFPTVSTYKYYTKLFDELGVETIHISPNNEEENRKILINIYSISEEKIKLDTEIKGTKIVFLDFNKDVTSKSFQNTLKFLEQLAKVATEKKKELS